MIPLTHFILSDHDFLGPTFKTFPATADYESNGTFEKGYLHRFFKTSQEICINVVVKTSKGIDLKIKVFQCLIVILFYFDVSSRSRTYFVSLFLAFCWDNLTAYLSFHIFKNFLCPLFFLPCGKPQQPFLLSNLGVDLWNSLSPPNWRFFVASAHLLFSLVFSNPYGKVSSLNFFTQSHSFLGAGQDFGHRFGRVKHGPMSFQIRENLKSFDTSTLRTFVGMSLYRQLLSRRFAQQNSNELFCTTYARFRLYNSLLNKIGVW